MSGTVSKRGAEIDRLISRVRPYLDRSDTWDVLINPPRLEGEGCMVWVDAAGGGLSKTDLVLDPDYVANVNRSIASELNLYFDREHPILMCELPRDGSRVTAIGSPITKHGPALCLRKPSSQLFSLRDYIRARSLDGPHPPAKAVADWPVSGHFAAIEYAVVNGKPILIVGSNAAGKTTFANAVLLEAREWLANRRLLVIEDLPELHPDALPENVLRVQPNEELGITDGHLLRLALRVRTDGIIVAELLRAEAAYRFLEAMNTGNRASLTTIHANDAHGGLVRCETLMEQMPGIEVSPTTIASAFDLVVFVTKLPDGSRRITEVARVNRAIARGQYDLTHFEVDLSPTILEREIA
jgi:Flp pilus assembly CpaF family ATPase